MLVTIFLFVYIIGTAGMFARLPSVTPRRGAIYGPFWLSLLVSLLWPLTIWVWMFAYWWQYEHWTHWDFPLHWKKGEHEQ